jgi:DNA-binding winged helix-turn-helix (wHTH) protein/tetratricopeptide (TPR) repeat protein
VTTPEKRLYEFDGFQVDPVKRLLVRDGRPVPLTPKAFSILLALLEGRGGVVKKEDLIQKVWTDAFVTDANLTQNISALRKALGERANDHRYVVTVPGQGYAFVADVADVTDVAEIAEVADSADVAAAGEEAPSTAAPAAAPAAAPPAPGPPAGLRPGRRAVLALAALALLAVVGFALYRLLAPAGRDAARGEARVARRTSVAVLGFKNLTADKETQWFDAALAEMLSTDLSAGATVRVVSWENVSRARRALPLPGNEALDDETIGRLRSILGADRLVVGSYLALGAKGSRRIRLDLRVLSLPNGDLLATLAEEGREEELFDLVARTGVALRRTLGWEAVSPAQALAARTLRPTTSESTRLYGEALERLRAFDALGARDLLQRAAEADPNSAAIHSELSRAWAELGYDGHAVEEAEKAVRLSQALPKKERLEIEGRYHAAKKEWGKASEIYRSLWTFFPDDLEYGLALAAALWSNGRGAEALAATAALRKLPPPEGEDPRIDLTEAMAAKRLFDAATQQRAAERALAKGERSGENPVVAQALLYQGDALVLKGRPKDALALFERARELSAKAGDQVGEAQALTYIGVAHHELGDLAGAEGMYEASLAKARGAGSRAWMAAQLGNLGVLRRDQGDLAGAIELLQQAFQVYVETEDRVLQARVLDALADVRLTQGDLEGARRGFEQALVLCRQTGSRGDEALALEHLGMALVRAGQLAAARPLFAQALAIDRQLGDPVLGALALAGLAEVAARAGDLEPAQRLYDQAMAARRQVGNPISTAQVLGALARLAHARGDLARARQLAAEELRTAQAAGARSLAAAARRELGTIAMAQGDLAGARGLLAGALAASTAIGEAFDIAADRLELVRLALAEGRLADAAHQAATLADWCGKSGFVETQARALGLLAESLLRQGKVAEARQARDRARACADRSEDRELRLAVAAGAARIDAAAGDDEALRVLRATLNEAEKIGFVVVGLETRLALGESELTLAREAAGRADLDAVRKQAEARGFRLLARRAEEVLRAGRPLGG